MENALVPVAFEHRIPAEEIDFLRDLRESRNMILTSKVDIANRKQQEKKIAKKRKNEQPELLKKRRGRPRKVLITFEQLPTTGHNEEVELKLVGDDEFCCVINKAKIQVAEIVTKTKCVLADRRCASLRQQADQLTPENFENPGTSKSSIHRKREKYRIESLKSAQLKHVTVDAWQLCYDGKIIDGIDRYVFIGQCFDQEKVSTPLQVKSFQKETSVTSAAVFNSIIKTFDKPLLSRVYSIMADTNAVNTGKKSCVNKRLEEYFKSNIGHQIHSLECLSHTNKINFTYAKNFLEGKAKGSNAYEDGALINKIKKILQLRPEDMKTRQECEISVTSIASNHLKTKILWLSDHKDEMKLSFRCDHMCLLALVAYLLIDVPENLKPLLFYRQETISHAQWFDNR